MKKTALYLLLTLILSTIVGFWFWNTTHHPLGNLLTVDRASLWLALGRLAGLLAAAGLLFQLILIGRVKWVESSFGLDHLTRLHRYNAFWILLLLVAHALLLTFSYAAQFEVSLKAQWVDFIQNWEDVPAAIGGGLLFAGVIGLSLAVVRRHMKYEWWHGVHLLAYVALALAFGHQIQVGGDFTSNRYFLTFWWGLYIFVLGNLVLFRVVKPLCLYAKYRFVVERVVRETDDVVSVYIRGRDLSRLRMAAGQFMILHFLAPGFRWQAHPFSLSCPPNPDHIRLSIKKVGDYTIQIPNLPPGTRVLIDGPHGIFTARRCTGARVLLIAGGIGITPIRSMAEDLVAAGKNVLLLYGNRRRTDVVFAAELDQLAQKGQLQIHHVFSDDPQAFGEQGHLDQDRILRLVPDVAKREVFICGPPPMLAAVIQTLTTLGVPARRMYYERFSL